MKSRISLPCFAHHLLNAARPYILKGKVDEDFGAVCITVNWIDFMDKPQRCIKFEFKTL